MSEQGAHWDSPTSRWDTGLRWASGPGPGPQKRRTMATIAINTYKLTIPEKLIKGQDIITKSTSNPNVPGNTTVLATFNTAQAAFTAANAACEANRQAGKQLTATRDAAEATWNTALTGLAGFTESATDGIVDKILSAGFDVKREPTPPQPVTQVMDVRVSFNGMPGYSNVAWKRDGNADAYVVERSADPITATSWDNVGTVAEAKYTGNGATPGQKYWYRVAAVNRLGQGPWSEPALRPVM